MCSITMSKKNELDDIKDNVIKKEKEIIEYFYWSVF